MPAMLATLSVQKCHVQLLLGNSNVQSSGYVNTLGCASRLEDSMLKVKPLHSILLLTRVLGLYPE